MITELLDNACKYTSSGETITVSTHATTDQVYLNVSNSGIEISASEQSRIFDRFYRLSSPDPWLYPGTGLGLALVKKLVERLGGTIEVRSANNQTAFSVCLPL